MNSSHEMKLERIMISQMPFLQMGNLRGHKRLLQYTKIDTSINLKAIRLQFRPLRKFTTEMWSVISFEDESTQTRKCLSPATQSLFSPPLFEGSLPLLCFME